MRPRNLATGWSSVRKISRELTSSSGPGTSGGSSWTSAPAWSSWKEEILARIGTPFWEAVVRRWEKDRPSCRRWTSKRRGSSGSPPRMK